MEDEKLQVRIYTGPVDSGKTGTVKRAVKDALSRGFTVGGVISEALMAGGRKTGYTAVDIMTGNRILLVSRKGLDPDLRTGAFHFSRSGFEQVSKGLLTSLERDILVIDEVGPLELEGAGYAPVLHTLADSYTGMLYLVVRNHLLKDVIRAFRLGDYLEGIVDCTITGPVSFEPWS